MKKLIVGIIMSLILAVSFSVMAEETPWWKQKNYESPLDQQEMHDAWNSRVKWDDGYMEITAGATADPDKTKNLAHARSMALKTARHLAYEKMQEIIGGVAIDSRNIYKDELIKDVTLRTSVTGFIKGARVIKEKEKFLDDGSIWMEVTIGLFLNHKKGLSGASAPWYWKKYKYAPNRYHPKDDSYKASAMYGEKYTGLVIDASNMNARPSMFPKILAGKKKKEVYGPMHVSREYVINHGIVGYAGSVERALTHERVGSHPLVVKATGTDGVNNSNILVSDEDATKIFALNVKGKFLEECRVVVVIN